MVTRWEIVKLRGTSSEDVSSFIIDPEFEVMLQNSHRYLIRYRGTSTVDKTVTVYFTLLYVPRKYSCYFCGKLINWISYVEHFLYMEVLFQRDRLCLLIIQSRHFVKYRETFINAPMDYSCEIMFILVFSSQTCILRYISRVRLTEQYEILQQSL